jgi:hypothetical protein
MNAAVKLDKILDSFIAGKIPAEELLLYVEPILFESARDLPGEDEVRKTVNAIERAIYTENEPTRSTEIAALVRSAVAFIRTQQFD